MSKKAKSFPSAAGIDREKRFLSHFLAHKDGLYAFIRAIARDPNLADDLLQEASLVMWEKFDTYQEGFSFAGWARAIALNKMRNESRRIGKAGQLMSSVAAEALMQGFDRTEGYGGENKWIVALRACMEDLSPSVKRLVEMKYFENVTLDEIAEKFNRTYSGVSSALRKARVFLDACIRKRLKELKAAQDE